MRRASVLLATILFAAVSTSIHAQTSFTLGSSPVVGSGPDGVVAFDVNGDGKVDLLVANGHDSTVTILTNNGIGSFALSGTVATGDTPYALIAADMNNDGRLDLLTANYYGGNVSVLTNNGAGSFGLAATLSVGAYPLGMTTADVNGDGWQDVVVANSGGNTLSVITNNGAGGYVPAVNYTVGNAPVSVCAADVNGDGKVDLISANGNDNTVTVLTNNGSGGFVTAATYAVGAFPYCVKAADVNGDGKVDLITVNYSGNTISVLTNNGSGVFAAAGTYALSGSGAQFLTLADVNGDGWPDLITANGGSASVSVFTNNRAGGFVLVATNGVGSQPVCVTAADVNGDGKPDLITANYGGGSGNTLSVLLNGGSFAALPPAITAQPVGLTNSAGTTAVFTVAASGTPALTYQWKFNTTNIVGATNATLTLPNVQLANVGNYAVTITNQYGVTNSAVAVLAIQNLRPAITAQPTNQTVTAGGTVTFAVGATGSPVLSYQWSFDNTNIVGATNATLALSNVTARSGGNYAVTVSNPYGVTNSAIAVLTVVVPPVSFTLGSSPVVGSGPDGVVAFDVNGDGKVDLLVANGHDSTVTILTNNGIGSFALSGTVATGTSPYSLYAADMNHDGKLDLLTGDYYGNTVTVLTNNGAASFGLAARLAVGSYPLGVTAADVNGDGWQDVVVANSGGNTLSVITNNGAGGYSTAGTYLVGNAPAFVCAADVNGDGKVDLISANTGENTVTVLTNAGGGKFVLAGTYAVGAFPYCVKAADVNGDGKVDLITADYNGSTLTVLTNNGSGGFALSGTYAAGGVNPQYVAVGDVNGDGWPDLISANASSATVSVFTNNGAGRFSLAATNAVGLHPIGIAVADVNGDGKPDLITANYGGNTLSVLINNGFYASLPPVITAQPAGLTNSAGTTEVFTVGATGTPVLSYQWSFDTTNIAGATNATLTLTNVQSVNAGNYAVTISNLYGMTNSAVAVLAVVQPPVVTTQPQSLTVPSYGRAAFAITASGAGPLSYHWRKNGTNLVDGTNISGSTTTNLGLASVSLGDAGNYDIVVSSPYGITNSLVAVLAVPQTIVSLGSTNGVSGTTIMVPVLINAVGVENSFEGSVGYDPTKMVLQTVRTGAATVGAYLLPVYTYTNSGFVGFAFFLNAGSTLPAGTQEVAELIFQTLPVTNSTVVNIAFGDYPDARQLLDNNLDSLPAVYQAGTVSLVPAEYAADVYPRFNGDSQVNLQDWGEEGRMVAGLDVPTNQDEFLRADCAPRNAPDGVLTVADWVQAGRYAVHLDPLTLVTQAAPIIILKASTPVVPLGNQSSSRILQVGAVSAQPGQTVTVPVELVCTTNENAVGMSVTYNPSQLLLTGVSLGSAATGGRLNINSNVVGHVGITLALLPGNTFPAGTNQVAVLQFTAQINATGVAPLVLDSSVAQLQVADVTANSLGAQYVNGNVTLPPAPLLVPSISSSGLQLGWQLGAGTFQVQSAGTPQGPWNTVVLPLVTNGASVSVTLSTTNLQQYFRLIGTNSIGN